MVLSGKFQAISRVYLCEYVFVCMFVYDSARKHTKLNLLMWSWLEFKGRELDR